MATQSVPGKEIPLRHFLKINGRYTIAPDTAPQDMLDDIGCLLEASTATIEAVIEGISNEGSQMAANASKDVPRMLYGVLY